MFVVFNKEKISAYIILLSTVIILFGIAFNMKSNNTVETSVFTNQISDCIDINEIYEDYSNAMDEYITNFIHIKDIENWDYWE